MKYLCWNGVSKSYIESFEQIDLKDLNDSIISVTPSQKGGSTWQTCWKRGLNSLILSHLNKFHFKDLNESIIAVTPSQKGGVPGRLAGNGV